jgi:hypothetical protein
MLSFFNRNIRNPESLRDEELEPVFIDLKNRILVTDIHANEKRREHLWDRIGAVLSAIGRRHERYIVDVEASIDWLKISNYFESYDRDRLAYESTHTWRVNIYDRDSIKSDLLLYLSFFMYMGGAVRKIGIVRDDPDRAIQTIDYLIGERDFEHAIFLKGFILKYGLRPSTAPRLDEARTLLETAVARGVGGALLELRLFDLHIRKNKYALAR